MLELPLLLSIVGSAGTPGPLARPIRRLVAVSISGPVRSSVGTCALRDFLDIAIDYRVTDIDGLRSDLNKPLNLLTNQSIKRRLTAKHPTSMTIAFNKENRKECGCRGVREKKRRRTQNGPAGGGRAVAASRSIVGARQLLADAVNANLQASLSMLRRGTRGRRQAAALCPRTTA